MLTIVLAIFPLLNYMVDFDNDCFAFAIIFFLQFFIFWGIALCKTEATGVQSTFLLQLSFISFHLIMLHGQAPGHVCADLSRGCFGYLHLFSAYSQFAVLTPFLCYLTLCYLLSSLGNRTFPKLCMNLQVSCMYLNRAGIALGGASSFLLHFVPLCGAWSSLFLCQLYALH